MKTFEVMYTQYASPTTFEANTLQEALTLGTGKCDCCDDALEVKSIKEITQ